MGKNTCCPTNAVRNLSHAAARGRAGPRGPRRTAGSQMRFRGAVLGPSNGCARPYVAPRGGQ
eukprot:11165734-Lingulodinium_polyedra.AAC.1